MLVHNLRTFCAGCWDFKHHLCTIKRKLLRVCLYSIPCSISSLHAHANKFITILYIHIRHSQSNSYNTWAISNMTNHTNLPNAAGAANLFLLRANTWHQCEIKPPPHRLFRIIYPDRSSRPKSKQQRLGTILLQIPLSWANCAARLARKGAAARSQRGVARLHPPAAAVGTARLESALLVRVEGF